FSDGILGTVLLFLSAGVITGLTFAGGLISRHGSRRITTVASVFFALALILPGLAFNYWTLGSALFVFGAFTSIMDVAMNAQAVEIERRYAKPLMGSFHASFSIGGFAGALIGAGFVATGFDVLPHFVIVSLIFVVLLLFITRYLVTIENEVNEEQDGSVIQLPPRSLWALGFVAFSAAIGEGSMADWSAIYLQDVVGTSEANAALGFAAFSLLMTAGRLLGDTLVARTSRATIVRGGGALAAVGILLAVLLPQFITSLLGFALVGAGVSTIIPLAFSAAGNRTDVPPGVGIAGVATIGYAGFLAGPPVIGLLAESISLRFALLFVAVLAASLVLTGGAAGRGKHGE
ncbi:MAG: MFS transporter, partial [Anaerolineae bacterium]|nr:MFS transporter [Anaerolineae bacterium]